MPRSYPPEARAAYVDQFRDPATVHAICEEYRAAATLDLEHDIADRIAGRRIGCPTLALWSSTGAVGAWYDPLEVWKGWADDLLVSFDGQTGTILAPGESVDVRRADHRVCLIRLGGDGFFGRMRQKLHWGDLSERESAP